MPKTDTQTHLDATNWPFYKKKNPHIRKNKDTGEFFCTSCEKNLSSNAGAAGKHCTKVHGLDLNGIPKQPPRTEKEKDDSLEEIKVLLTQMLSEMRKPKEDEKKPWYQNVPDYDEKVYEYIEKLSAIASVRQYAKMRGVPEKMLDKYFEGIDSKNGNDDIKKEKPFDVTKLFLYNTLVEKNHELANLVLYSMVIDELKRHW